MYALQVRFPRGGLRMQIQLSTFYVPRSESPGLLSLDLGGESIDSSRTLLIVSVADIRVSSRTHCIEHLISSTSHIL